MIAEAVAEVEERRQAMCNERIRREMKRSGIYCWQVADALNIAESTFYRMMRHELPEKRRSEVLAAIAKVKAG